MLEVRPGNAHSSLMSGEMKSIIITLFSWKKERGGVALSSLSFNFILSGHCYLLQFRVMENRKGLLFAYLTRVVFPRSSVIAQLTTGLLRSWLELESVTLCLTQSPMSSSYHLKDLVVLLLINTKANAEILSNLGPPAHKTSSLLLQFMYLFIF